MTLFFCLENTKEIPKENKIKQIRKMRQRKK